LRSNVNILHMSAIHLQNTLVGVIFFSDLYLLISFSAD
jgi:hypothetical protein